MAAASIGERGVVSVCSLVQVPIALRYLGIEGFGLWMTLTSLTSFMYIADLGLGAGMQNKLAETYGQDNLPEAQRWFASGTLLLFLIGVCMFAVTLPFCFLIDWGAIFHVANAQDHSATNPALAILVSSFFLGLPLTGIQRLAAAFQIGWLSSIKNAAVGISTLAAIVIAARSQLGFLSFMLVVVLPPIVGNIALLVSLCRRLHWRMNFIRFSDRVAACTLLRQNWLFVLPTIGALILGFSPPLVISGILGAAALTPYNLAQKLLGLFSLVQVMLLAPLWPAYTEAKTRGDIGWIRATYKKSLHLSIWLTVIPTLSFGIWGRWALHFWTGKPVESFDPSLLLFLSAFTAVAAFAQPIAFLLNALGKIKGQASYGLVSVLIALTLMPHCIRIWGIAGAPLSLLVAFSVCNVPLAYLEARFHLKTMDHDSRSAAVPAHEMQSL